MPAGLRQARLAVCLCAWAVLAYEISLTRVFSVLFRSPYVFLILSIAVCGLGLGAAVAAWRPGRGEHTAPLIGPAVALAVAVPLPVLLMLTLLSGWVASANAVGMALLTLLPYLAAGVLLARAFSGYADQAGRLYFFDLAGAALAACTTGWLLGRLGGLAMPFVIGAAVALGALALAWPAGAGPRLAAGLALLLCGSLAGLQVTRRPFDLPPLRSTDSLRVKPLFQELADPAAGAEILYTEWSAVARTDVVRNTGVETLYIWTDGDVPTQMEPFSGDLAELEEYRRFVGFAPFALQPAPERVLCIGPGGGLDILLAVLGGAKKIEPVELNPAILRVTERFRGFYGDLYSREEVSPGLIIDEGRSYLSRSPHRYDVIYFALAKSATTQQGGLALVDNHLYTVEAFEQYLDHLAPGGLVALVMQDEAIVDRCLVTAVEVMLRRGLSGDEIADRLLYLSLPPQLVHTPYRRLLLLRNGAFEAEQLDRLRDYGEHGGLMPVYVPSLFENSPYDVLRRDGLTTAALIGELTEQDKYLIRPYPGAPFSRIDLTPVTDDRPFYADLSQGLHPMLRTLLVYGLLAGLLAVALALVWQIRLRRAGPRQPVEAALFVVYFAGLGAGFLMVEVALIQKLVLLLGYPTLSLSVILFALLLGSALGGAAAQRGPVTSACRRVLPVALGLAVVLELIGAGELLTRLAEAALPLALPLRVAVAVAVVLPLGWLMGQPFPTGLRYLGAVDPPRVPVAWAVNGVFSVTGSVIAAALAGEAGYRAVLLAGAVVYLVVALAGWRWMVWPDGREGVESPAG